MFFKKKPISSENKDVLIHQKLSTNQNSTSTEEKKVEKPIKKIKKIKPIWDSKHTLIDVQFPAELNKENMKKKYKLHITYKDPSNKIRKKTIRFGKKNTIDFIEDGDNTKKNKLMAKLGNTNNLFHQNFWRFHLLNGESKSLKENYINLISNLN